MKKLLTIAALVGATSLSFGQGYVSYANTSGSRFSTNALSLNGASGGAFSTAAATAVGGYYFALFAAPSTQNTISTATDPTLNGWTYVLLGTNTASAGRLLGNNVDTSTGVQVPGFASGTTADFAVAGWTANIGSTWAAAQAWWSNGTHTGDQTTAGWFGINGQIANDVALSVSGGPYPATFANNVAGFINGWGLTGYALNAVPEPSSFALAGLGAAAMLIFRRRK